MRATNGYGEIEFVITPHTFYILVRHIDDDRRIFTDGRDWPKELEPSFLVGLALQLPFALAALLVAWALDSVARAVGYDHRRFRPNVLIADAPDLLLWATRIAERYMGAAQADAYGRRNATPSELLVRMTPTMCR